MECFLPEVSVCFAFQGLAESLPNSEVINLPISWSGFLLSHFTILAKAAEDQIGLSEIRRLFKYENHTKLHSGPPNDSI